MEPIRFKICGARPKLSFALKDSSSVCFQIDPRITIIASSDTSDYEGEYTVTPKVYESTTLETKHKRMRDDVKINKIPRYYVSNDAEGTTLIIGDEYYG